LTVCVAAASSRIVISVDKFQSTATHAADISAKGLRSKLNFRLYY